MGGDGRAPRLLLGQWGLHDEAFPTAAAAPRAGVLLEDRQQCVRGVRRDGRGLTIRKGPGFPPGSQKGTQVKCPF